MGKAKQKVKNWSLYNRALVNRGSVTFWLDEKSIEGWHYQAHQGGRGRGFQFSDTAIETALMIKAIFSLPLRATEGFLNSVFELMGVTCRSPGYRCLSKRAKTFEVAFKRRSTSPVAHVVVDATGLKVYGEGEWHAYKHGREKRRRKLHLAVDSATHDILSAQMSMENVGDNEVLPVLLNPLRRKISQVSAVWQVHGISGRTPFKIVRGECAITRPSSSSQNLVLTIPFSAEAVKASGNSLLSDFQIEDIQGAFLGAYGGVFSGII